IKFCGTESSRKLRYGLGAGSENEVTAPFPGSSMVEHSAVNYTAEHHKPQFWRPLAAKLSPLVVPQLCPGGGTSLRKTQTGTFRSPDLSEPTIVTGERESGVEGSLHSSKNQDRS